MLGQMNERGVKAEDEHTTLYDCAQQFIVHNTIGLILAKIYIIE